MDRPVLYQRSNELAAVNYFQSQLRGRAEVDIRIESGRISSGSFRHFQRPSYKTWRTSSSMVIRY